MQIVSKILEPHLNDLINKLIGQWKRKIEIVIFLNFL